MTDETPTKPLTRRQQVFIEQYLTHWNATKAARLAGYADGSARQQGSRLLANANVTAHVRARITELKMQADEVLVRLAEHARGDIGELLDPSTMTLDTTKAGQKTRLIKKWKQTVVTGDERETIITEVELYDAQAALVQLGKANGALKEGVQTLRIQMVDELTDDELARIATSQ